MRATKTLTITLPLAMLDQVERLARQKHLTKSELIQEALSRYMQDRKWQNLPAYGSAKVRKLGLKESDGERLVQEYRVTALERELAMSLKDVEAGRVYGPFSSVDATLRSLRGKAKKQARKK